MAAHACGQQARGIMAGGHAIALLNAGAYTTTVAFTLRDSAGNAAATSSYALKPNHQAALFHSQLPGFENLKVTDGSVELHGSTPFFVLTLGFEGHNFATAVTGVRPRHILRSEKHTRKKSVKNGLTRDFWSLFRG